MSLFKQLVKGLCFILCFILIFMGINQVLVRKDLALPWDMTRKIHGFYNEPQNTFEVMFFGSSHMYCTINPVLLWEESGVPSYIFSSQQQPFWVTYHYLVEALKTQSPKVVVMEVHMAIAEADYMDEATNYSAIDYLPWSKNKLALIQAIAPEGARFQYLFNFMKYHSRWQTLTEQDFTRAYLDERDPFKGYVQLNDTAQVTPREDISAITPKQPLAKTMLYLEKIIKLSKDEGFQLVLLKSPSNATAEYEAYYHAIWAVAEKEGIPYVDYNYNYDTLGLDPATDFYDERHLNYLGATKVTKHFATYLKENFALNDHRSDPEYSQWTTN